MQVHVGEPSRQEVAATSTRSFLVKQPGTILVVKFIGAEVPGVGESMTIDLLKNGVTVLTAALVYDDSLLANTWYPASLDAAEVPVAEGDLLTVDRVYAAGAPTPIAQNEVVVELGP